MMGSTASMELPGRKSDLLPTRMIGILGRGPQSPEMRKLTETTLPRALPITWAPSWSPHSPAGSIWFESKRQDRV